MTAFVILAAGKATRLGRTGEHLHKALLPLDGRAIISHLFDLAPYDAHLIVVCGDRTEQIISYVELAHPDLDVDFCSADWLADGAGPGASLLAAEGLVAGDSMIFTSCDTLWEANPGLWTHEGSWAAVAPVPAGTDPTRWCRFDVKNDRIVRVLDKKPGPGEFAYVGMARITRSHIAEFWQGLAEPGEYVNGELQVSGGFETLWPNMQVQRVNWTDVGDEAAYRAAVANFSGYDWTKIDQATWVLPDTKRVVKYHENASITQSRIHRGWQLGNAVPYGIQPGRYDRMFAYDYVQGRTVYDALDHFDDGQEIVQRLLEWRRHRLANKMAGLNPGEIRRIGMRFYRDKTFDRIDLLDFSLAPRAADAARHIDWDQLVDGIEPGVFHGDLNFGNVIIDWHALNEDYQFIGIDWREDFGGQIRWGDLRYDIAKLLGGTQVHWGRARRGDFTRWPKGVEYGNQILRTVKVEERKNIWIIAALSLINSAPLHAEPLDAVLVARGCALLEQLR
jgi:NDP-sugar pyrophosphorylase family protein